MALDDALKKSLPKIDKFLTSGNVKHNAGQRWAIAVAATCPARHRRRHGSGAASGRRQRRRVGEEVLPNCGKKFTGSARVLPELRAKLSG
jgi:hypothetical protein